jgi:hypothetical protein
VSAFDEARLAELIGALPPAPQGWVQAAQELPLARREIDEIVSLAEADAEFRAALIEDLEAALARRGFEPSRPLIDELRRRFTDS